MTLCQEYKIDGVSVVAPDAEVEMTRTDVEAADTGKDESGVLHRFLLRSKVRKWTFGYTHLTKEEYQYMEELLAGKASFGFTFPNENGTEQTCTAYCSGSSVAIRNIRTGLYSGYSFEIVES